MNRKNMKLLVLGDQKVGKSTLIHTIYSEVSSKIQKTLKKVTLPPEMCLYSKDIFTQIIDTSVDVNVNTDLQSSDLILLVYDVSDPLTVKRIQTHWLPKICEIKQKIPIILVGNKMDKKQLEFESEPQCEYQKIKDILKRVTKKYKNVQMGIQCSAFYDQNVKSVLNCAQRAVLYPLSPLYNLEQKKLTTKFEKALTRIFRILDSDGDGKIRDEEMAILQERVFQTQLNSQDLKAIKQIILRQLEVEQSDYIQLSGFLALQKKIIEMLKIQICWSILRYFGYTDELTVDYGFQELPLDLSRGESPYINSQTENFLLKMYHLAKKNKQKENKQNQIQQRSGFLENIFYTCPFNVFKQFQVAHMEEQKFITNWNLYAFLDFSSCYRDILYLGYDRTLFDTFDTSKVKKRIEDLKRLKDCKVFSVLVVQAPGIKSYIDPLFIEGVQTSVKIKGQQLTYKRVSKMFSGPSFSKILLFFKIKQQDINKFFENDSIETNFVKRVDLIVQFEDENNENIHYLLNNRSSILYKKVSKRECEEVLHTIDPPKLDLQSFPIKYDDKAYDSFYTEIVLKTIHNIEEGLSKQKISQLIQESKKKKNQSNMRSILVIGAITGLATLAWKYFLKKGK